MTKTRSLEKREKTQSTLASKSIETMSSKSIEEVLVPKLTSLIAKSRFEEKREANRARRYKVAFFTFFFWTKALVFKL